MSNNPLTIRASFKVYLDGAFSIPILQRGGAYGGKQKFLSSAVSETKEKLATLKTAAEQANQALANGDISKEQHRPPERQSVLKHLREIQERNKQKPPQKQRKKSIDRDSR